MRTVVVEAECGTEFAILLSIYKKPKIQYKIFFSFDGLATHFTCHLGLATLLTTVIVCGCTMLYLVIKQQHSIKQMQKSLYSICLKSIAAQNSDQENNDSGVDNNWSSYQITVPLISLQGDCYSLNHSFCMVEELSLYIFSVISILFGLIIISLFILFYHNSRIKNHCLFHYSCDS